MFWKREKGKEKEKRYEVLMRVELGQSLYLLTETRQIPAVLATIIDMTRQTLFLFLIFISALENNPLGIQRKVC